MMRKAFAWALAFSLAACVPAHTHLLPKSAGGGTTGGVTPGSAPMNDLAGGLLDTLGVIGQGVGLGGVSYLLMRQARRLLFGTGEPTASVDETAETSKLSPKPPSQTVPPTPQP